MGVNMKHQILIGFEPGSKYQEDVQLQILEIMLEGWKKHVNSAHKKNVVDVVFTVNEE